MTDKNDYQERCDILSEEFESFVYSVSHDLGAQLRHIRSFGDILAEELGSNITNRQKDALFIMTNAANTGERMLDGLLIYSRISSSEEIHKTFNSYELFVHMQAVCGELLRDRNVKLNMPKEYPEIFGDIRQLCSLVVYLVENAIKFCSDAKMPVIDVRIEEGDQSYIFAFKDNGIGIDKKYFEDIFIVFRQLEVDTSGVGLGLTLAKKIVQHHGGNIWLESEVGVGSIFYVSLPKYPGEL